MKKILLFAFTFFIGYVATSQVPILYYDFELNTNRNNSETSPEMALNDGNTSIQKGGSGNFTNTTGAGAVRYSGNSGRAITGNNWSRSSSNPGAAATDYYQFTANTTGFYELSLQFDKFVNTSGPQSIGVSYSIDGVNFIEASTGTTSWLFTNSTFNLPTAVDNKPNVVFRIYGYNAGTGSGTLTIDNLQLLAVTFTGQHTLPDYDFIGSCMASGDNYSPSFDKYRMSGVGTIISLNSKLKINTELSLTNGAIFRCEKDAKLLGNSANVYIQDGCVLQTASNNRQGAVKGSLGSNILTMNPNATIEYIGDEVQYQETNGLPNVIVNNSNGVEYTGDVVINGNLTLKKGALKSGIRKLTIKGNLLKIGGTLDAAAGEVAFEGEKLQTVADGVFSGSIKRLTIKNTTGVNFDTDATITEALSLLTGTLTVGNKKLTIKGSIIRNGTTETGAIDAENGTIEMDGSLSQSIPSGTFHNNKVKSLRISNTNVAGVSLNATTEVTDVLDFGPVNNGKLKSNGNLTLKSDANGTARIGDLTNGGVNAGNTIEGDVSIERFSPAWSTRRYRLMTSPVMNTTINAAWQEGARWNGVGVQPAGFGTLITGQQQGTASTANTNGFDYWSAIANGSASVKVYLPGTDGKPGNWQSITSTTAPNAFDNHQAYLVFIRGDRSVFSGTAAGAATVRAKGKLKSGSFSVNVPANQGHTLIGNPYASPLDFKQLYEANNTKIQPYFWAYQASLGTGTGGYVLVRPVAPGSSFYETIPGDGSKTPENRLIHSGEGFFVMPNASASGTNAITFQEKFKSNGKPSVAVFRQEQAIEPSKLYINVTTISNGVKTLVDGIMAQFGEAKLGGDVVKSPNATENISIVKSSSDLIVTSNTLPGSQDTTKLRFWNSVVKEYQLEIRGVNFAAAGVQPILVDAYLRKETLISLSEEVTFYPFNITNDAASKNQQRFYITYKMVSVLPLVTINSTVVLKNNSSAHLCWGVSDEKGVKLYTLEKSSDNINFTPVATMEARNTSGETLYNYIDSQIRDVHYYRIKLTGTLGDTKYSTVMKVEVDKRPAAVNVFPNPVRSNTVQVNFINKPAGLYTLSVYGMDGIVYANKTMEHAGGSTVESIALRHSLPSGNYKLEIRSGTGAREMIAVSVLK